MMAMVSGDGRSDGDTVVMILMVTAMARCYFWQP